MSAGLLRDSYSPFLSQAPAPTCAKTTEVHVDMLPDNSAACLLASPIQERNEYSDKVYGNFGYFVFVHPSSPCRYHLSVCVAMEKAAL